jgi:hypothetical protein
LQQIALKHPTVKYGRLIFSADETMPKVASSIAVELEGWFFY